MPQTIPASPLPTHRLSLEDVQPRMAKVDLKKVEDAARRSFGLVLARCVALASLTQKEAAGRLGVDPAQFARWISGVENGQVWRFHHDDVLGPALIAAQAEATDGATVRTVIELRRKVG